jgi:hypothetical protein
VISDRAPLPNHCHPPQIEHQAVEQTGAGDDGEPPCRDEGDGVAKVQQRGCDTAEDDAELEPREKGALGGEVDFGFNPDGDVDS